MTPEDIIDRGRRGHTPSDEDRARVRRKLVNRLGEAAFLRGRVARAARRWTLAKIGVALVVIGGVGLYAARGREKAPGVKPPFPAVTAPSALATTEEEAPLPMPTAAAPEPAPTSVVRPQGAPTMAPSVSTAKLPQPEARAADSLEAEMSLLSAAQRAIVGHDWALALRNLDEHEKRFPTGVLSEERAAARVVALCGAGRVSRRKS